MQGLSGYPEEKYLMLSGLEHFLFCSRQWALIHIEQLWSDNFYTAGGIIMHERAHDEEIREKRGDKISVRGMNVRSERLGISGICDVVEFIKDDNGINLSGEDGKWLPFPVEYKRGSPKEGNYDTAQLCAQCICLEEMLLCRIEHGALYYGETKHRLDVEFTEDLRRTVENAIGEMHKMFDMGHTPLVKPRKGCIACSLKELCLPQLSKSGKVADYISAAKSEE